MKAIELVSQFNAFSASLSGDVICERANHKKEKWLKDAAKTIIADELPALMQARSARTQQAIVPILRQLEDKWIAFVRRSCPNNPEYHYYFRRAMILSAFGQVEILKWGSIVKYLWPKHVTSMYGRIKQEYPNIGSNQQWVMFQTGRY